MTRQEHLDWCKRRALEYVEAGENGQALASMASDLGKHPDTKSSVSICAELGLLLMMNGHLETKEQMREWINGFN